MEELKKLNTTLVLVMQNNKILLGEKKRGFACGTINGFGGKQDANETITQTMIRETQEECGITPTAYDLIGKINFDVWYKGERTNMFLSIYICTEFVGNPTETDEMKPCWFDINNIPFEKMLKDDLLWYPYALAGKKFKGKVKFNKNMEILSHNFIEVEKFDS